MIFKKSMAIFAIPFLMFSGLPQTWKLLRTKSSKDISIPTYVLTWCGIGLILTEASGNVFWANLASFTIVSLNLLLILKYAAHANR